jgi:hypothetical protein
VHPETEEEVESHRMLCFLLKALQLATLFRVWCSDETAYCSPTRKDIFCSSSKSVGTLAAWHGGIVASNVYLEALTGNLKTVKMNPKEQLKMMVAKFDNFSAKLNERLE